MTCNMIPDGKSKAMSTVSHAIYAKVLQKGQGAENKKSGKQEAPKQVDQNSKVNVSKKEAAKAAKKEAANGTHIDALENKLGIKQWFDGSQLT